MGTILIQDTNVLVRFLINDDPHKAGRCYKLFRRAGEGKMTLRLSDACLAELVWTLELYHRLGRQDIAARITAVLKELLHLCYASGHGSPMVACQTAGCRSEERPRHQQDRP